jgi:hypothetical protein
LAYWLGLYAIKIAFLSGILLAWTVLPQVLKYLYNLANYPRPEGFHHDFSPRTFKLLFHMTPYKYLRQRRMKRAAYMLRDYAISITEVCNAVGFKSLSNFSWEFQKWYGVSPRAYHLKDDNSQEVKSMLSK